MKNPGASKCFHAVRVFNGTYELSYCSHQHPKKLSILENNFLTETIQLRPNRHMDTNRLSKIAIFSL